MTDILPNSISELTALVINLQQQITGFQEQITSLQKTNNQLRDENQQLKLKLSRHRIDPPPIVKPNTPDNSATKKRKERVKSYVRFRSVPDKVVFHAYSHCLHCGTPVTGDSVAYEREIIDLPVVKPIVTLHKIIKRHCTGCGRWVAPRVDWSKLALGHSRFGVGVMSILATLREVGRLPVRVVGRVVKSLFNLSVSDGEVVEATHRIANQGKDLYQNLHQRLNQKTSVHADETGWRENGKNGYIWNFSTPKIRYYIYRLSRGKNVVDEVLTDDFGGVLTTDFYAAYNHLSCPHQRCWAHLLRHIHQLTELYPDHEELVTIKQKITKLFTQGKEIQHQPTLTLRERHCERRKLESKILRLVKPYLNQPDHPFRKLAKRIDYYLDELFTFVLEPNLDPTNNPAERAVRHQVIKRKISGGTRSNKGSQTQERLTTFFSTWSVNNLNPLEECRKLLTNPNYATEFIQEL